jgi:hypothetical protein
MSQAKKEEEIILPGSLVLLGSLMLRATFGDQAWQKYQFNDVSDTTFRIAAKFYTEGHPDHALLEVFRLMEAYLQSASALLGFSSSDKPEKVEPPILPEELLETVWNQQERACHNNHFAAKNL